MWTFMSAWHCAAIERSRSRTDFRPRQLRQTIPHSSPIRWETDSSQPSGSWEPRGLRSPRRNARHAQSHQGVARTTSVSARSNRRSLSTSLLSTIHSSPASSSRCFSRNSPSATRTQPGFQLWRSRWITGRPTFVDSARENVLFPAPAMPVTTIRLPTIGGVSISLTAPDPDWNELCHVSCSALLGSAL